MNSTLPFGSMPSAFAPARAAHRWLTAVFALLLAGLPLLGQAQALATFPMTSTTTNTPTVVTGVSAAQTFADLLLSNLTGGSATSSNAAYTDVRGQSFAQGADGSWAAPTGVPVATRYEQFAITASTGSLNVQTFKINTAMIGSGNGRLAVLYSTDAAFGSPAAPSATTLPAGVTSAAIATLPAPTSNITLQNVGSGTGTSGSGYVGGCAGGVSSMTCTIDNTTTGYTFTLNGATGVNLSSAGTTTLYVRLYYNYNSATATTGKYVEVRNVTFNGTAGAPCANTTALSVPTIGSSTASVTFTQGTGNSSTNISVAPTAGGAAVFTAAPATSPVSVTGLSASTGYTVTATGNCSGVSSSVTTNFTTTAAGCADPTGVSVTVPSATSAQLNFTAVSGNTNYTVAITPSTGVTVSPVSPTTTSPVTFTGLSPATAYSVTIQSNCPAGTGTIITRTFTTPVANSTRVQEWSMRASNADSANVRSVGVTASTPALTGLVSSNNMLSGGSTTPDYAVPAYSAAYGQAIAPAANGGSWAGGTLSRTDKYEQFTITAGGTYSVRLDSLVFANAVYNSSNGKVGVSYSTDGFATNTSEVTGGFGPAHVAVTGSFTAPAALPQVSGANNTTMPVTAAGALTAAQSFHLALNGATGVTLAAGQVLTVRFYYAVGSSSTGRYVLLRDVIATGQATFTPPSCGTPTGLSVGSISGNSASLSFTPGSGGGVTYTVTYYPTATPASSSTVTPAPSASPVALTGLQASTPYTVTVQANCSVGGPLTSGTASTTFTTTATVLERWSLRVTDGDSTAARNAAVTASTRTMKRLVLSDGSTPAAPAHSAKLGVAVAPNADGTGFSSTFPATGPGSTPSPRFYEQFTVTAAPGNNVRVDAITYNAAFYNTSSGNLAVSYSLNGFAAGTDSTQILASTAQPNTTTNNNVTTRLLLNGATGVTLTAGQTVTIRFYFAVGSNSVRYALLRDVFVEGAALPASPVGDLTVTTAQGISGTYNNVTIANGGTGTVSGPLTVNGTLTVQSGGTLVENCQTINGTGNFALQAGGTLRICNAGGIAASGATGPIQTTGTRSFSNDASYTYNGTVAQSTGSGLPARVRNLTVNNSLGLTLTNALAVRQLVRLQSGDLATGTTNNLTLLSTPGFSAGLSAGRTALIDNTGGVVTGTANVMQRAVDNVYTGDNIGYHHFSSPMTGTTLGDLGDPGFAPVFNDATGSPAFNATAAVGYVRPFPTVLGYDQSRVGSPTLAVDQTPFNQGYFAGLSAATTWVPGTAYAVNSPNAVTLDFTGQFNNAPTATAFAGLTGLTRGTNADAGWQLLGNPFPAPLDFTTVAFATQATNLDPSIYQYHSTSRYGGYFTTYQGNAMLGVQPTVPAGGGFFMRVTAPNSSNGALSLSNANRVKTYSAGTQASFGRAAASTRPVLTLTATAANGLSDALTVYAQAGATAGLDPRFDAAKLTNPHGLNLAARAGTDLLAIDGRPAFAAATVVPLSLGVPAAGTYALAVTELANFGSTRVYLRDAATGTDQLLSAGTQVRLTLASATAGATRYALVFRPAGALATAPNALAAQATVYPNPAHERFTLTLPPVAGQQAVRATLVNALGQVVNTRTVALPATGTTAEYATSGLAAGVYALRLTAGNQAATLRVVVQ